MKETGTNTIKITAMINLPRIIINSPN
jgi:hypothetical protein